MTGRPRLRAVPDAVPRGRAARPRGRAVRRRRAAGLLRLAVFLLLVFIAAWAGARVAHAGDDPAFYSGTAYTVRAGDDLWTIAAREYGDARDLRKAVFSIRAANGLATATLQPGQRLVLPYLDP